MKKFSGSRKKAVFTAVVAAAGTLLSGCGDFMGWTIVRSDTLSRTEETVEQYSCPCTCDICIYGSGGATSESVTQEDTDYLTQEVRTEPPSLESEPVSTAEGGQEPEPTTVAATETAPVEIRQFTEGELEARRKQQRNFAEARQTLYSMKNSKEKTSRINQMDRQILANNAYDFSGRNIVFIGDSITEGITSAIDANGRRISYVTYADSYLHFNRALNHGKGGRMFATYGGEDFSLAMNFGNVTNVDSDIIVVFAGVNDYLSVVEGKRFGDVYDKMSTAGYCGAVRYFMKQLTEYYGDRDIFFVTMYNNSHKSGAVYTDFKGQPTLDDFIEVQRKLAAEYGFNIIELYDIGFMDCTDKETSNYYLRDGLHPKDNGNIALGEHIAAELSLYFGQK